MSESKISLSRKYNLFPITDKEAWEFYVKHEANFWTFTELEYVRDKDDYEKLKQKDADGKNAKMKRLFDMILGFFGPGDGLVVSNIVHNFLQNCETFEESLYFLSQIHIEGIHAVTYGLIIDTLLITDEEKKQVFEMVDDLEVTKQKAIIMEKYRDSKLTKSERYVAFACAEGILFCVLFNIIYWFRSFNMFQNFIFANEKIAQDESSHRNFGCNRFKKYNKVDNISKERVVQIIQEFVDVEKLFIKEMLPQDIDDLTQESLLKYLHTVADNLIVELGFEAYYKSNFSPSFLSDISNGNIKANFFEVRVGNYISIDKNKALNPDLMTGKQKEQDPLSEEIDF